MERLIVFSAPRPRLATVAGGTFLILLTVLLPLMGIPGISSPAFAQEESHTGLLEIPTAPLEGLEPAVRTQLEEKRRLLDEMLQQASVKNPAELDPTRLDVSRWVPLYGDLGQLYLLYDRPETAVPCFVNVTRLVPGEPNAWYYLGVIHQDAGRFDQALEALDQVLAVRADDLPSLLRRGEIQFQQRRLDEAYEAFQRALELVPQSASANFGMGRVVNARRQWPEAIEFFEKTLSLQPDADSVYHPLGLAHRRLKNLPAAREALAKAGPSAPIFDDPLMRRLFELSATSRSFYIEGNRARRRGLSDLAESHYRRALELDPTDASVHYNLGTLLGEMGRVQEAQRHFAQAVQHDPEHRDARFNWAVGLRAEGNLLRAEEELRRVVQQDPDDASARLEWGATLYASGRAAEGQEQWQRLLDSWLGEESSGVEDPDAALQLARYLLQTGQETQVNLLLERTLAASTSSAVTSEILVLQSDRALAADERTRAVSLLEQALAASPPEAQASIRLADIHCGAGRPDLAFHVLDRAVQSSPESRKAKEFLARLLASSPDPKIFNGPRALELARQIFAQVQGPLTAETMAMAMAAQDDFPTAIQWQERLVREVAERAPLPVRQRLLENLRRYQAGLRAESTCGSLQ